MPRVPALLIYSLIRDLVALAYDRRAGKCQFIGLLSIGFIPGSAPRRFDHWIGANQYRRILPRIHIGEQFRPLIELRVKEGCVTDWACGSKQQAAHRSHPLRYRASRPQVLTYERVLEC